MDRLSELPDEIIHQIISRIPNRYAKCAAKLTILSKRWKHIWLSYPVLEIDCESVGRSYRNKSGNSRLAIAPSGSCKLSGFCAATTKKFTGQAPRLNVEEIIISFSDLRYESEEIQRMLDDTLAMVSDREPEKIDIFVQYSYPIGLAPLINNPRLRILNLTGCELGELSTYEFGEMINLRELYLSRFSMDDSTLNSLIASAPSLEILELETPERDGYHKRLRICNHPKLKSILFKRFEVEDILQIKGARSLETLEFVSSSTCKEPDFEISTSPLTTVRMLKIKNHCSREARCLTSLISATPSLEELYLSDIALVDGLNIVNPTLRRVTLDRSISGELQPLGVKNTIHIDAPKLVQFHAKEHIKYLPSFSFATKLKAGESFIAYLMSMWGDVITQKEFIDLKCFLANIRPQFRFLYVSFSIYPTEKECTFDRDQIQDDTPAIVIGRLYFYSYGFLELPGIKAFFDGLFWSCQPLRLLIARRGDSTDKDWSRGLKVSYVEFSNYLLLPCNISS
ncbi:F-box/LRR-repeat protein At5g02910 [Linum grandiflorum]